MQHPASPTAPDASDHDAEASRSRPARRPPTERRLLVLLNPRAGTAVGGMDPDRVSRALAEAGADAELVALDPRHASAQISRRDPDGDRIVVAAGGDGTLRRVAAAVADGDRVLGILPLGTRNHFARDAGLPLDLAGAIDVLLHGRERRIDVGRAGAALFLNNASMGLYPRFVEERRRRHRHTARWSAIAGSAWWVLRQHHSLRLRIDDEAADRRAAVVFVGNNDYRFEGLELGRRTRLDEGLLTLVLAHPTGPVSALRLLLRALLGRLEEERDYDQRRVREIHVRVRGRHPKVALDGEPMRLASPLHFHIQPGALRLLTPEP